MRTFATAGPFGWARDPLFRRAEGSVRSRGLAVWIVALIPGGAGLAKERVTRPLAVALRAKGYPRECMRSLRVVRRSRTWLALIAMETAREEPTTSTSFLPRVMAV